FGPFTIARRAFLHEVVVHIGEHGVVHLQDKAGVVDFKIFLAQRVGDGEDIVALVLVIFVLGVVAGAGGRDGGEKPFLRVVLGERRLQVTDIAAYRIVAGVPDRTDTGITGRAPGAAREFGFHEFAETHAVAAEPDGLVNLVGAGLEAAHALEHIVGPARLAVFAVVHHIDARLELALHDVAGRRPHGVVELLNVIWIVLRLRRELPQLRGADDAADVGREDTVVTASHVYSLQSGRLAAPQFAARDARALAERFELRPLDRRVDAADMRRLGEAAVGA